MIRVTLEFATVEETILALGKMSALGKARRAANAPAPLLGTGADEPAAPPSAAVPPAPAAGRKPRSDAGKPRGSYRKGTADGSLPDANTGQAPESSIAPAPSAEPPAPAAPEKESPAPVGKDHEPVAAGPADEKVSTQSEPVTAADAQAALEVLFNKKGIEAARKTLGAFGVQRLKDLKEADRAAFISAAKAALS